MRGRGLIGGFCAACAGLWSARLAAPLLDSVGVWWSEAVTHSGARVMLRLCGMTFAFDRGLLSLLGQKWQMLIRAGTLILPPGTLGALRRIADTVVDAITQMI